MIGSPVALLTACPSFARVELMARGLLWRVAEVTGPHISTGLALASLPLVLLMVR